MKNLNLNNLYQSYINSLKHSLDKVDMKKLSLIVDIFITTF